jgi:CBS domain-containing protein
MNIAHILARKGGHVYTVKPEQTIREALALLAEHNVGALVVVDRDGGPVGILSERDIVREAVRDERLFDRPVRALMAKKIIAGTPEDELMVVAHTMTELRVRHLPVVEGRRLVGIVSIGDVVKAQRDEYEGELATLQILTEEDGYAG